jgi:hypothetical protein
MNKRDLGRQEEDRILVAEMSLFNVVLTPNLTFVIALLRHIG